jgi:hypothetical protein
MITLQDKKEAIAIAIHNVEFPQFDPHEFDEDTGQEMWMYYLDHAEAVLEALQEIEE